ncbi:AraC-like DNA-binding protein [Roseimicrobium gellanilyticum]|uniref:AraC-like DNA-binding protein n=1 Tax=Roseimicrobium gellanilyticum TaxID=748857 RepID=A0A366H9H9_9BACT|nr:AraC family transcriptional regulator [Roseimicrobium gellanilyticum]RBP38184.1 AraC-like DNA-binding protein [Roseimicrobium gellanilyticum]
MNSSEQFAPATYERLLNGELFQNYREAFQTTTGLRLSLDTAETIRPESAIPTVTRLRLPVRVSEKVVAWVTMQPVVVQSDKYSNFEDVARAMLEKDASAAEIKSARETYSKMSAVTRARLKAVQTLLQVLAVQLSEVAEQLFLEATESEPAPVRKAREFVMKHLSEAMFLEDVARYAGVSAFHFCKVFKKHTGHTFTSYVNHVRVEHAKKLLMKPRYCVTEVAFDAGFQSLSQFNRSFRRVTSKSPTEYRSELRSKGAVVAHAA